ncbi:ataxia telangiectasia mutated family protein [Tanacetum coccineum]|uniref:Ataxia telangiectasia mutated family protein n=1 Tax=Tanacetum coccineum TaxID=301880 RepID=A0ABQ4ZYM2_9ASTR
MRRYLDVHFDSHRMDLWYLAVKLFLSEESPSQVGVGGQDHLQAKSPWPWPSVGAGSDDNLPPGFEGSQPSNPFQSKLSQIPVIQWKCPARGSVRDLDSDAYVLTKYKSEAYDTRARGVDMERTLTLSMEPQEIHKVIQYVMKGQWTWCGPQRKQQRVLSRLMWVFTRVGYVARVPVCLVLDVWTKGEYKESCTMCLNMQSRIDWNFLLADVLLNTNLKAYDSVPQRFCLDSGFRKPIRLYAMTVSIEAIHIIRSLMEKYRERQKDLHLAFLDLEKAYDSVPRVLIWKTLSDKGTPTRYIKVIQDKYEGCLIFADDIVLVSKTPQGLNERLEQWRKALEDKGLRVSREKTEYMRCNFNRNDNDQNEEIRIGDHILEPKESFRYLGSVMHKSGRIEDDVTHRIQVGWLKWRAATGILCDKKVPLKLKGKFYRVAIRPAMLYGSECWPLTKVQANRMEVAEMRMLRWTCGKTIFDMIPNGVFRTNLQVVTIVNKMREGRLRWFGHVKRRPQFRIVEALTVDGARRGRPKLRWVDRLKTDLKEMLSEDMTCDIGARGDLGLGFLLFFLLPGFVLLSACFCAALCSLYAPLLSSVCICLLCSSVALSACFCAALCSLYAPLLSSCFSSVRFRCGCLLVATFLILCAPLLFALWRCVLFVYACLFGPLLRLFDVDLCARFCCSFLWYVVMLCRLPEVFLEAVPLSSGRGVTVYISPPPYLASAGLGNVVVVVARACYSIMVIFVIDSTWQVAAGEESKELEVENQREMRVLEAVYPRASSIPPNPASAMGAEESSHYNDQHTPIIPITPIEDEDMTPDTSSSVTPPATSVASHSANGMVPSGMTHGVEPDVMTAAYTALNAAMSNTTQASLIDPNLLMKILSNPTLIEQLVSNHGPSTSSQPLSQPPAVSSPNPPLSVHARPPHIPFSTATSSNGPAHYQPPNRAGTVHVPVPASVSVSSLQQQQPPQEMNPRKDINYYKSLIQQHGGENPEPANSNVINSNNNSQKTRDTKSKSMKPCIYFNSSRGCRNGASCVFQHDSSSQQRVSSLPETQSAKRMKMDREITGT